MKIELLQMTFPQVLQLEVFQRALDQQMQRYRAGLTNSTLRLQTKNDLMAI